MIEKNNIKEIEKIKNEYSVYEPNKMDKLRKLDRQVKRPAETFAYTFGTAGSLVLGTGMCLAMGVIGASLSGPVGMALGVIVGAVGIVAVSVNYLIYNAILKKRKSRFSQEILDLSSEILNEE